MGSPAGHPTGASEANGLKQGEGMEDAHSANYQGQVSIVAAGVAVEAGLVEVLPGSLDISHMVSEGTQLVVENSEPAAVLSGVIYGGGAGADRVVHPAQRLEELGSSVLNLDYVLEVEIMQIIALLSQSLEYIVIDG